MSIEHSGPEIIQSLLVDLKLGTDPGDELPWPAFIGLPNDPSEAIGVFDFPLPTQGRIQKTGETISFDGIQIRVRSNSYVSGQRLMHQIRTKLDTVRRKEISVDHNRYEISGVHQMRSPAFIGEDENDRKNFTLDCLMKAREI